ncbi:MAG: hypothetical protein WBN97_07985 [Parvibaculum sp.]
MKDAVERIFLNNIVDFTLFSDGELRAIVTGESNMALVHAAERELSQRCGRSGHASSEQPPLSLGEGLHSI